MARMRTVKPALRTSVVVASWPFEVRYAWVLLWGYLDDEGRGLDIAKAIAGDCFPLDESVDAKVMERWLRQMTVGLDGKPGQGPLCRYQRGGRRYLHAVNWREHQRPNRPTPSQLPSCPVHGVDTPEQGSIDSVSDSVSDSVPVVRGFEGLKGGGVRSESRSERAADTLAPPAPRTCAKHPQGTDRPCRACERARETAEAWGAEQRQRIASAPKCPIHPDQIAEHCGPCRSERIGAE